MRTPVLSMCYQRYDCSERIGRHFDSGSLGAERKRAPRTDGTCGGQESAWTGFIFHKSTRGRDETKLLVLQVTARQVQELVRGHGHAS